jgi:putative acetyltransferase
MPLSIERVDPLHADALALLEQAASEACTLYPELFAAEAAAPTNEPAMPGSVYLVAYDSGVPVGCAALQPVQPWTAEVRRMFVSPHARRIGIATALIADLEQQALRMGYRCLVLETGARQQPAITLYEGLGFRRIPSFGPYVGDPLSACFEKALDLRQAP